MFIRTYTQRNNTCERKQTNGVQTLVRLIQNSLFEDLTHAVCSTTHIDTAKSKPCSMYIPSVLRNGCTTIACNAMCVGRRTYTCFIHLMSATIISKASAA